MEVLTTFNQRNCFNVTYIDINGLSLEGDDQYTLAKSGQGQWILQSIKYTLSYEGYVILGH